ncbi:MFS transporter [Halorussus salinus]|uniref:MFS transporter n=1 Tax=Halorussus salinus TaxID=1364935 RepID=UPI0010927C5A|nr:MFS transporter [Halorussus salinus]
MIQKYIDSDFSGLFGNGVFMRLFFGRVVTDVGDSLYFIGSMWIVFELTGSAFYTGVATALMRIPDILTVFIGPLIDRWQLRRILLSTQLINGVAVLLVPLAALTGHLSVWLVLFLIPLLKFINGFVYPAQNAALPRLVEEDELTRANSLFSTSLRTVDMIANAAAGALIAIIGAVALFVVNSVTFAVAALMFIGVTVPKKNRKDDAETEDTTDDGTTNESGYLVEFREGIDYVRGSALPAVLFGMMVNNLAAVAVTAILPAFADSIGGPAVYGLLTAAIGAGGLVGAASAFLVEDLPFGWVAAAAHFSSGALILVAVAVPGVWATALLVFIATIPTGMCNVLFFSMVQSTVDNTLLGRVTSLVSGALSMMAPAGGLLGGALGSAVGNVMALYGVGITIGLIGIYYLLHPQLNALSPVTEINEAQLGLKQPD